MSNGDFASLNEATELNNNPIPPVVVELNVEDYMDELADFDMAEAQKIELLQTLWSIMGAFARMGFSVDVCGLIFEEFNEASAPESGSAKLLASTNMETPSNDRATEAAHE